MIAANWKMNKTIAEAREFCEALPAEGRGRDAAEVVICPPFLALTAVVEALAGSAGRGRRPEHVLRGRRRLHRRGLGGDAPRRRRHAPSSSATPSAASSSARPTRRSRARSRSRSSAGLLPILCVGETEEERERDETDRILRRQIDAGLSRVPAERLADVVIAYEPIWAIGTGKTATPEQAEDACGFVRSLVSARDEAAAERIRILYGGSVKPANAAELLGREEIDGALVGGASLDPDDFAAIVAAAG